MQIKHRSELGNLVKHLGIKGDTAEVGAAEMLFTADMLSWNIGKHYIIDNWGKIEGITGDGNFENSWHESNYQQGLDRIKKYNDRAIVLRGMSVDMAKNIPDNSLALINIDCDHSYEGTKGDIEAYWSKLVVGGIMAFHDHENVAYGVKQAVKEFAEANDLEIFLIPEDRLDDAGAYIIKK